MSDSINVDIDIKHLTRVEGHGNIRINVKDGVLEEARLDIVESPRFFEAMLEGRGYDELAGGVLAHHLLPAVLADAHVGGEGALLVALAVAPVLVEPLLLLSAQGRALGGQGRGRCDHGHEQREHRPEEQVGGRHA